jgi:hypothetical protein
MPAGTPRGFNLQNFGMGGLPSMPGFAPGNFSSFLANGGMPTLGWPAGAGRGGPDRRGGRQFQSNSRTGPYDRTQRGQRYGENGGARLSPPPGARRGGAMASTGGRWGDGAAGGAAVGPREAVQGRSLKSYEDLDAVAGGGSGELNY